VFIGGICVSPAINSYSLNDKAPSQAVKATVTTGTINVSSMITGTVIIDGEKKTHLSLKPERQ
jgi:hypothetical protein